MSDVRRVRSVRVGGEGGVAPGGPSFCFKSTATSLQKRLRRWLKVEVEVEAGFYSRLSNNNQQFGNNNLISSLWKNGPQPPALALPLIESSRTLLLCIHPSLNLATTFHFASSSTVQSFCQCTAILLSTSNVHVIAIKAPTDYLRFLKLLFT